MKKHIVEFVRRGLIACGFGPIILAVVYLILQYKCDILFLSVNQVCVGIFSITVLAFIAGGMNFIYQIEHRPLMVAIFIHGIVLYISYLVTYLINGWLELGTTPVMVFTLIFILGYIAVWIVIYSVTKKNTDHINEILKQKQETEES